MKRIMSIIVVIALIAVGAYLYFSWGSDDDTQDRPTDNQTEHSTSNKEENETHQSVLENVFHLAEEGKIPDEEIVVGETKLDDVYDQWGKTDKKTDVEGVTYLEYPNQSTTVGVENDIVVDARSFQEDIKKIDLNTIEDYKDDPDDERYFKDDDENQIIFVYELPNDFQLKWVLPEPTDDNDNPNVHHMALTRDNVDEAGDETASDEDSQGRTDGDDDMSLDEKIGQMIFSGVAGTEMNADTKEMMNTYHVGGIILFGDNIESAPQTVEFLNDIKKANESSASPLLLGVDEEGGKVTRMPDDVTSLPTSQAIASLDDADLSHQVGTVLGEQMNELGFNLDFAPVMDVNSNPDNPVIGDRSFGDNPDIVSELGIQTMKGIQSGNIISVMKHFPGHGDTGEDSHLELPKVDKSYDDLANLELIPFQNAIENGADVSMIAHILLPQIDPEYPASMSEKVITNILREDIGFDGVVITDDLTMGAITDNYDIGEAALQSIQAGSDLMLVAHDYDNVANVFNTLKEAVKNGELSEERIDESVERIHALKEKYAITDDKTGKPNVDEINSEVEDILEKVR